MAREGHGKATTPICKRRSAHRREGGGFALQADQDAPEGFAVWLRVSSAPQTAYAVSAARADWFSPEVGRFYQTARICLF